jgi:hypothetical protein
MDTELLEEKFRRMGARVKIHPGTRQRVAIDIGHDRKGEFFDLTVRGGVTVNAIDVRPAQRHLLLAAHDEDHLGLPTGSSQRFLCGHDERAWFVAAVPEGRPASNVAMAMDALKPIQAIRAEARAGLKFEKRHRRHNAAWKRQGEWFFIPADGVAVQRGEIVHNERLVRSSGGKPHNAEFCVREGGEVVWVDWKTRKVISATQYRKLLQAKPKEAKNFLMQRRNMRVLVRGRISHDDHKTLVLHDWHEVAMNTENQSVAMRSVTFID